MPAVCRHFRSADQHRKSGETQHPWTCRCQPPPDRRTLARATFEGGRTAGAGAPPTRGRPSLVRAGGRAGGSGRRALPVTEADKRPYTTLFRIALSQLCDEPPRPARSGRQCAAARGGARTGGRRAFPPDPPRSTVGTCSLQALQRDLDTAHGHRALCRQDHHRRQGHLLCDPPGQQSPITLGRQLCRRRHHRRVQPRGRVSHAGSLVLGRFGGPSQEWALLHGEGAPASSSDEDLAFVASGRLTGSTASGVVAASDPDQCGYGPIHWIAERVTGVDGPAGAGAIITSSCGRGL